MKSLQSTLGQGFTLVEVLVSLTIVSVALMAGLRASGTLTNNAQRQLDMALAQSCAENTLQAIKLAEQFPSIGDSSQNCLQLGKNFQVALKIRPTPNPAFRRVDVQVLDQKFPLMSLSTVIGKY